MSVSALRRPAPRIGAFVNAVIHAVSRTALAAAILAGAAGLATAGETVVNLDGGIVATLNMPDHTAPVPAVLMLHGFGSSRDEVGGMYKRAATALAMKGIASLRIDFLGFGDSAGDSGDITVDGQVEQAKAAFAFLSANADIDPKRLGVLGFSLGGGVATLLASDRPSEVKSLVTWSSVGDFGQDFRTVLGDKAFDRAKEDGIVGLDLGFRTIALKQAFFDSLSKRKIDDAIANFPGAYLTITGAKDFSAAYSERFVGLAKSPTKEVMMIPDGDHIFKSLEQDQSMAQSVIDKTADWFSKTL
ncbi:pimeloyl-ACP methyl ester carboxylesterase [Rhizobium sp. SG_E_25_P2]|uniref:alpha/beta hydrolase family protein n=1 Tax=Rhizobium sp. SG_E_25_P2 TaxID=2879942 RepID=UPI0024730FEA|nr:alpha/beta fold hydrolase [Rhizobium sp. SG_E_25_P2]MDH6267029.1 pimeloyl-ACP methyl ester carboxylesterase [Rhizobium sp. SG_E_25_P2]